MKILETQTELRAARHIAGQGLAWRCMDCGAVTELGAQSGCGTGYGYVTEGADAKPVCYACCGKREKARMIETGRATLYLVKRDGSHFVTDWPSTLAFKAHVRTGSHNMAGRRYDAWFTGPDGAQWHGVTYGDNTQICHAKRLKAKGAKAA